METKDIIKKLRNDNNLTQAQLGELLNCDRTRIVDIERGKTEPKLEDIKIISREFKVSTDYLLGLSAAPTDNPDEAFICNYTGLSLKSVRNLKEEKNNRNLVPYHCTNVINSFIENLDTGFFRVFLEFCCADKCLFLKDVDKFDSNNFTIEDLYNKDNYSSHYALYFEELGILTLKGDNTIISNSLLFELIDMLKNHKKRYLEEINAKNK